MKKIKIIFGILLFPFTGFSQVPTDSLKLELLFSGNTNDGSGYNHNVTTYGNPSLTTDRFNKPNSAYYFDGVDDNLTVNNLFNFESRTLSIWFYIDSTTSKSNHYQLITIDNQNLNYGATGIYVKYDSTQYKIYFNDGEPYNVDSCNYPIQSDIWNNFTMVKNGKRTTYYFNGLIIKDVYYSNYSGLSVGQTKTFIATNRNANGQFFKGKIDDIRIYNRALDSNEVKNLFNESGGSTGLPNTITSTTFSVYSVIGQQGTFLISTPTNTETYSYKVYDTNGREISSGLATGSAFVSLNNAIAGIYLLHIIGVNGELKTKIITH